MRLGAQSQLHVLYKEIKSGARYCDNCEPQLFEVEEIKLDKIPGLKRGRKKDMDEGLADLIRTGLMDWREDYLLDAIYLGTTIISAGTVLGDDVIEQLVKERVETAQELSRHTRWVFLSAHEEALFHELQRIYATHDAAVETERERIETIQRAEPEVPAENPRMMTTMKNHLPGAKAPDVGVDRGAEELPKVRWKVR
ncbi:hypothetical protein B0H14DRAFT_2630887 [Mycena olivaceomarginata]|nr:hypothetical protein B0H14DRAFT_2630887 [Mycena olivaceomarginata]